MKPLGRKVGRWEGGRNEVLLPMEFSLDPFFLKGLETMKG
jgi:hypothetical protein